MPLRSHSSSNSSRRWRGTRTRPLLSVGKISVGTFVGVILDRVRHLLKPTRGTSVDAYDQMKTAAQMGHRDAILNLLPRNRIPILTIMFAGKDLIAIIVIVSPKRPVCLGRFRVPSTRIVGLRSRIDRRGSAQLILDRQPVPALPRPRHSHTVVAFDMPVNVYTKSLSGQKV